MDTISTRLIGMGAFLRIDVEGAGRKTNPVGDDKTMRIALSRRIAWTTFT